jgi:type II secretory pathway pseudopilin PulG
MVSLMRRRSAAGFSMPELMVIVALIGILSGTALISVQRDRSERQREALNSTVENLATWIDTVRSRAATGTVCTVTITPGTVNAGGTLASVSPASCGSTLTQDAEAASLTGALDLANTPNTTATITLTTEGGAQFVSSTASVNGFNGLEVALSSNSVNLRRCLAISAGTGNLLLGGATTSGGGTCFYTIPL